MGDGFPSDEDVPATFSTNKFAGDVYLQGADKRAQRLVDTVSGSVLFNTNSDTGVVATDPVTGTTPPVGTDVGFGAAARRYIQTGILNGDFAIPPQNSEAISAYNPLPYWNFEAASDGSLTATVVTQAAAASGNALRLATSNTAQEGNVSQYVPVPRSQGQQYRAFPSTYIVQTAGAAGTFKFKFAYYDANLSIIGSTLSTNVSSASAEYKWDAGLVPPTASYIRVLIVGGNSTGGTVEVYEVRCAFVPAETTVGLKSISANVGATTSETSVAGITIPANSWTVGTTYRLTMYATVTAGVTGRVVTMRVRLGGGTLLGSVVTSNAPTTNSSITDRGWVYHAILTCRSVGATGTVSGAGWFVGDAQPFTATSGVDDIALATTTTVDTTAQQFLEITLQTGNVDCTATGRVAIIECVMAS